MIQYIGNTTTNFPIYKFSIMCGRILVTIKGELYWAFCNTQRSSVHGLHRIEWLTEKYEGTKEVFPTDYLPVITKEANQKIMRSMYWNILPSWSQNEANFYLTKTGREAFKWSKTPRGHFNMRSDTLTGSPKWNKLLERNRGLIAVSRYIEWQERTLIPKGQKVLARKYGLKNSEYFFLAGIWDKIQKDNGEEFYSVAFITTSPNTLMQALPHHRMPVIIPQHKADQWLAGEIHSFLTPYPADEMLEEIHERNV